MTPFLQQLAEQIQRLLLSKNEKTRLLRELPTLNAKKLESLAATLQHEEQETLQTLNKKALEIRKFRQKREALESGKEEGDIGAMIQQLFLDPEKLAQFLGFCSDAELFDFETVIIAALSGQPKERSLFEEFFHQARLYKLAFQKQGKQAFEKAVLEQTKKNKEKAKTLDQLIGKIEQALKTNK